MQAGSAFLSSIVPYERLKSVTASVTTGSISVEPFFPFLLAARIAHGRPAGDSDPNNTPWPGVPCIAPEAFHTGKRQHSPERPAEVNGTPAGVLAHDEPVV